MDDSLDGMKFDLYTEEISTTFLAYFLMECSTGLTEEEFEDMAALYSDLVDRGVDIDTLVSTGDLKYIDGGGNEHN